MDGGPASVQFASKKVNFPRVKRFDFYPNFLWFNLQVFCDYPPTLANAIPNVQINNDTRYKIDTEVEYQCDIGYTNANDLNRIICLENGKWSELKFKCTSESFRLSSLFDQEARLIVA
jgi:hypothetical protein